MLDLSLQAVRCRIDLIPVDGPSGRIYPPTYPGPRNVPQHVVERLPDGSLRVLVDSVASQANRHEAALVGARRQGLIDFSDVTVDLGGTDAIMGELSATEMPHRLSDAILRDSEIDGVAFGKSAVGQRIIGCKPGDLSPLIEASPTTLLFGAWFSQHKLPNPLKIQRTAVSEVWAHNAVLGMAVGSRIDPLGIEKLPLYEAADGDWTALENEAVRDKGGKFKPHAIKRPSEMVHGNIAPSVCEQGITAERITLNWALPLAALRKLHFGTSERDRAAQTYIGALAIASRVLDHEAGYSFRSRCDLVSNGPVKFESINRDGAISERVVTVADAVAMLQAAEAGMTAAGFKIKQKITVKPSKKLTGLIAANAAHQAAGDISGDEA